MTYGPDPGTPAGQPVPYQYQGQPSYAAAEPPGYFMGRKLASWGARVGAYLLDSLFVAAPTLVIAGLAFVPLAIASAGLGPNEQPSSVAIAATVVLACVAFLVELGLVIYSRYYLQGRTGQSWGKRVMHLRLVRMADGQPIGGGMAFVRDIAHIVDGLICYVGYLMPLWDDRRQTVADKMLNTVVLDER
ncbi:MAG TPA: RDD family protein [Actinomycetes bacterium]